MGVLLLSIEISADSLLARITQI